MRHIKMTSILAGLALSAVLIAGHAQAQATTNVTVVNQKTTSVNLISTNLSGTISPTPQDPIPAITTDTLTSSTPGTVDSGVLTYSGCRFNWSKVRQTPPPNETWSFSIGATPSSACRGEQTTIVPTTGAYAVRFTIRP